MSTGQSTRPQEERSDTVSLGEALLWIIGALSIAIIINFSDFDFNTEAVNTMNVGGPEESSTEDTQDLVPPTEWFSPLYHVSLTGGAHGRNNQAVDMYAEIGTKVFASGSGVVVVSQMGYNNGHGNYIVIAHGQGIETVYCHLSVLYVEEGQRVVAAQLIGLSGNTGHVRSNHGGNGAHLHFGFRGPGARNPFIE